MKDGQAMSGSLKPLHGGKAVSSPLAGGAHYLPWVAGVADDWVSGEVLSR